MDNKLYKNLSSLKGDNNEYDDECFEYLANELTNNGDSELKFLFSLWLEENPKQSICNFADDDCNLSISITEHDKKLLISLLQKGIE